MNTLGKLIAELCPDGVEYRAIGELGEFYSGLSGKSKEDFVDGNARFISYMNVFSNTSTKLDIDDLVRVSDSEKQNAVEYGDVLFTGSSETKEECGMASVITRHPCEKIYLNSFCFGFRLKDKKTFEPDFMKHLLRSDEIRKQISKTASGVTRFNVSKARMEKVCIPIPPLPVQKEIVRMLDEMAGLIDSLEEELAARKKQYEWCRERLLRNVDDVEGLRESQGKRIKRLGTLVDEGLINMTRGDYITKKDALPGDVPVILGGQEPAYFINRFNHSGKAIVISRSGASAGFVSYWNEPIFVTDGFAFDCDESYLNTRYLFYVLKRHQGNLNMMKKGGGVPHITGENLKAMELNLPPLSEQQRIVKILDSFDTLCNSMTEGLPGEIALRKQQYEYYRDKLLAFKRAG